MDIEVTNSPDVSVVEPQSVPSRISVVLVKDAKVGGTQCLGCPRVDQDGVAKPASVTACEDSHVSPCAGGMLSSSDIAGRLFPVVPAGIPFPVGPVGPVGPDGPNVGPLVPCGTLSPSDTAGPVRQCGMLSPPNHVAECSVGPGGTLYSPDPAGILSPAVPAGIFLPVGSVGPVGPIGPYGTLSPSDSESAISVDPGGGTDPVLPTRMHLVGPLGTVGTLLPGEDGPGLCPIGLTVGLLPVVAVPLPAVRDPMIALSPVEGLERDCAKAERCYIGLCGRVRGMG